MTCRLFTPAEKAVNEAIKKGKKLERRPDEIRETEKRDIRNRYKNTTEFKIPDGTQRGLLNLDLTRYYYHRLRLIGKGLN
jgi:hypothetical protein